MKKSKLSKNIPVMEIAGILGGAVAAGLAKKFIKDKFTTLPNAAASAIPIGLGILLTFQKNSVAKNAGIGMIVKEGVDIIKSIAPNAIGEPNVNDVEEFFTSDTLSLPADQSIMSLPADQSILAGIDADENEALFGISEEDYNEL